MLCSICGHSWTIQRYVAIHSFLCAFSKKIWAEKDKNVSLTEVEKVACQKREDAITDFSKTSLESRNIHVMLTLLYKYTQILYPKIRNKNVTHTEIFVKGYYQRTGKDADVCMFTCIGWLMQINGWFIERMMHHVWTALQWVLQKSWKQQRKWIWCVLINGVISSTKPVSSVRILLWLMAFPFSLSFSKYSCFVLQTYSRVCIYMKRLPWNHTPFQ